MNYTVKERLKAFISFKKMSVRAFERACGLSNGYVNSIEQTIMPNKLSAISSIYPDLSITWLLTGEGDMLRTPAQVTHGDYSPAIAGRISSQRDDADSSKPAE